MSTGTPLLPAGVFAHPDDEIYQIGGTLALHAGEVRTTLVFCTSGDAGPITSPELATRKNLGEVREREQAAAMALVPQRMAQVLGAGTGASSARSG